MRKFKEGQDIKPECINPKIDNLKQSHFILRTNIKNMIPYKY